jgi:DNA repair protein RadA/Sms
LSSADIFANIAGGIRIDEPAADLAVAVALSSADRDAPLPPRVALFGEISLTGELRSCSQSDRRIAEAQRYGFSRLVVPTADAAAYRGTGLRVQGAGDLREALRLVAAAVPDSTTSAKRDDGGV